MNKKHTPRTFLAELMLDIDVSDPHKAIAQVKQASRQGEVRTARQQQLTTRDEVNLQQKQPQQQSSLDKQIAILKQRLTMLQQRKTLEQQRQKNNNV